ncbi:MAG: HD domain-containing protein [Ruminiclostridium sp.]|nr:HD domain-containing protein [Ruminiclostridium sp.]
MEFEINRVEVISQVVCEMLENVSNPYERQAGYIHLFGVSQMAALLAKKRGLSVEIAQISALLHDYYAYMTGDREKHASKGADMVLPLLAKTGLFSVCEVANISRAVLGHSDKEKTDGTPYEELLKDADVLQHIMDSATKPVDEKYAERYSRLKEELGLI